MRYPSALMIVAAACVLGPAGCTGESPSGPPEIRYGQDACEECGMIISERRFAAAALVSPADRPVHYALFDDVGCLLRWQAERPANAIQSRFVHHHNSAEWLDATKALYVRSASLNSPMGFGLAAYGDRQTAERVADEHAGEVLSYDRIVQFAADGQLLVSPEPADQP